MTAQTEKNYHGEFIIGELPDIAKDTVILVSGQNVEAGTVLGKITTGGKYTAYDNTKSDGSEVAAGIAMTNYDASAGDIEIVLVARHCEVIKDMLVFAAANDGAAKTAAYADLAANQIIVRDRGL
jgi:hypothetical protein